MKTYPKTRKRLIYGLQILVACIFIFLAFRSIGGIQPVIDVFSKINIWLALLTMAFPVIAFFLASFNIWLLLNAINPIPYRIFLKSYLYSYTLGLFIPGQLGDATLALFLRKYKIPLVHSSFVYAIDKGISLLTIFVFVWLGTYFIIPQLNTFWYLLLPVIAIIVLIAISVLIYFLPVKWKILLRVKEALRQYIMMIAEFRRKWHYILINITIGLIKFLVVGFSFYFGFLCFGQFMNYPKVTVITFASSIIGYIPVSFAGIGTVEYSAISFFALIGIKKQIVLSVYVLMRLIQYVLCGITLFMFRIVNKKQKPFESSGEAG